MVRDLRIDRRAMIVLLAEELKSDRRFGAA